MWTAKITFDGSSALIGSRTLKYHVNLFAFPLSWFYEKGHVIVNATGILIGEEKKKKAFIRDFKKAERLINLEQNEDFLIFTIKEASYTTTVYNKDIIHLAPTLIDEDGKETLTIGCFSKKELVNLLVPRAQGILR